MDGSQYPSNGINNNSNSQTYPSPTALSPNNLQSGSPLPQTLPPLQPPATATMQPIYGSNPHTPRTPGTPNTPNSGSNSLPSYQQNTSQPGSRTSVYSMAQNPYPPPHQGYGTSGAMMQQSTTAASHPQPIAPAPAGSRGPPVLRPMPPGGIMPPGVPAPYGGNALMQPTSVLQDIEPTHVVGSQGRRGILPSAPGRPAAPAAGTGAAKTTQIPPKDADGKFPCPHCTKTYLHAKHLKRHLLRHTGDRPYMCVLCRDTFSRSDILKRHFQKCSIRRGNPTGASHLSHPQAHVKKNAQAQKAAGINEGEMNHLNGINNMPPDGGIVHPFGMVPVQDGMNNVNDQNQMSRPGNMNRVENGANQDRRTMPPNMGNSQHSQLYSGEVPGAMNNQQPQGYNMPPQAQNGMPMYAGQNQNQQSGLDWSQMFPADANRNQNRP
ncbi:hypothetical protein CDD80_2075 [Ophiocordyceps camponoti-rufipedis]|uniref:C2H2-type domain-containing protein n=1 Tax=Ophiocordyceps camponoti-rufipedis TaxID=2004952 RepID=A0A2C5Z417_9HYPO|nr:hypothetical protein CDD80_2075 [Ophiocordyceps camponoti-rufipedis]